jgi:hypothetical protein
MDDESREAAFALNFLSLGDRFCDFCGLADSDCIVIKVMVWSDILPSHPYPTPTPPSPSPPLTQPLLRPPPLPTMHIVTHPHPAPPPRPHPSPATPYNRASNSNSKYVQIYLVLYGTLINMFNFSGILHSSTYK